MKRNLFVKVFAVLSSVFLFYSTSVADRPNRPIELDHPASSDYKFKMQRQTTKINGRQVDIFFPVSESDPQYKAPVVVFGHGQAIGVEGYELTFKHMAQKGIAVIHPAFDSGFFDQDWRRMAKDFNDLTTATLEKFPNQLNAAQLIYSGHSKGGYIALMAASAPGRQNAVQSLILFAPAGFDSEYIKALNPDTPVTLAWPDGDTVIKQSLMTEIYGKLPSRKKQLIVVKSYPSQKADHFFPLSKSYFFGGQNGESPFHYYGSWKWMIGAAWDVKNETSVTNTFIYGSEAATTGLNDLSHSITKSW